MATLDLNQHAPHAHDNANYAIIHFVHFVLRLIMRVALRNVLYALIVTIVILVVICKWIERMTSSKVEAQLQEKQN